MTNKVQFLICVLSLCSLVQLNAQRQFSVGVQYTPTYAYRYLINKDGSAATAATINTYNDIEVPRLGHTAGLLANWQWTKFNAGLGVSFMQLSTAFKRRLDDRLYPTDLGPYPIEQKQIWLQNYISLPLALGYRFYNANKWHLGAEVKFIPSLYLSNKSIDIGYYEDGHAQRHATSDTADNFNTFLLGASLGFTADYDLSEHLTAFASPVFYSAFQPLNNSNSFGHIPYTMGLSLGLKLKV